MRSTSELAIQLQDCRVGDELSLPVALVQEQRATVEEIQSKYVRAFQDSLENFQARFPDTTFVQRVHLGSGDEFDLTPIIESLKERREFVRKCVEFYRLNPCSIYLFAERIGTTELDSIRSLAHIPEGVIKCSQVSPRDFELAVQEGRTRDVVVLDLSAILTLSLLDGWELVGRQRRLIVSRSTKEVVDHWLAELDSIEDQEGGRASVSEDGQLFFTETTREMHDSRRTEIMSLKQNIETRCEIHSAESVAALEPKKRDAYGQIFGLHGLEAMCLARDLQATLWSDDHMVSFVAQHDMGTDCAWTQLVLARQTQTGELSSESYNLVSAKLASWSYTAIIWNSATIIAAGEHAEWDVQAWPFKQCIELVSDPDRPLPTRARIALDFLKRLRRSSCSELRQSSVIQAILDAVGDRRAIMWMCGKLDATFGLDFISPVFLRLELEYWLRNHVC